MNWSYLYRLGTVYVVALAAWTAAAYYVLSPAVR